MSIMPEGLLTEARTLQPQLLADRRQLHAHPEVGPDLPQTREYVARRLREMGYDPRPLAGGLTTDITGRDTGRCVLLRADMDALRITERTDLPFRAENGAMHACGHDLHAAMLLGAARLLRQHQAELSGTVRLVFQPDEEGFTGAKAMLAAGVLTAEPRPQSALALHVHSGTPTGLVLCGRGTFMAGCTLFRVTVRGTGCHGAMPETGVDPLNIAAHIYLALQELPAREVAAKQPAVVTVGRFQAFHIGGARSALFNYLLARKTGGKLILRIEDTDRERSTPESEENIKAALKWLGMDWDEGVDVGGPNGPYHQMERLDIYKKYTDKLLAEGKAYYCYCTDEELEKERQSLIKEGKMPRYMGKCRHLTEEQIAQFKAEGRKPTVRFRVPADKQILVRDMVRGDVVFDSNNIGDFVIVKSDGIPTYNYAVVIDDALMHITHVIRAEEHLSNTPRQCLVYDALGFKQPTFGHISLILGKDHTKMSKRHGATSVDQYRQLGYLPEAINNFLALLGWAPNSEQEIFSMDELIHEFSMDRVAKNPAVFDIDKLNWINQHYMRQLDAEAFFEAAKPHMIAAGYMTGEEEGEKLAWLKRVVATAQEHISYAAQIPECVEMYFNDEFDFEN